MTDQIQYADLVKQAEQAVKSVSDPELRRVAFEKILAALLEKTETTYNSKPRGGRKIISSVAPATKRAGKKLKGPKAYIHELIEEKFFTKPKALPQVKAELENRGHHIAVTSLSGPLQSLCKAKLLRRQKAIAPGKAGKERQTYTYSEW